MEIHREQFLSLSPWKVVFADLRAPPQKFRALTPRPLLRPLLPPTPPQKRAPFWEKRRVSWSFLSGGGGKIAEAGKMGPAQGRRNGWWEAGDGLGFVSAKKFCLSRMQGMEPDPPRASQLGDSYRYRSVSKLPCFYLVKQVNLINRKVMYIM